MTRWGIVNVNEQNFIKLYVVVTHGPAWQREEVGTEECPGVGEDVGRLELET